jgi:hypothetical protein
MPLYKSMSWRRAIEKALVSIRGNESYNQYVYSLHRSYRVIPIEQYNRLRAEYLINPTKE